MYEFGWRLTITLLLLLAVCVNEANAKEARSEKLGFTIQLPSGWTINSESPFLASSAAKNSYLHGVGVPSKGVWIDIDKKSCVNARHGYQNEDIGAMTPILTKVICQAGFEIDLHLWASDKKGAENMKLLDSIASTFRVDN